METLSIAYLAEYIYCQRSSFYFLTGSENGEEENKYIQRGRGVHSKIDIPGKRYRDGFEERKGVFVKSFEYGLIGKTDLIRIYGTEVVPVEYKSGEAKTTEYHQFQLALQALCIMEQLQKPVTKGFVYFYQVNQLVEYNLQEYFPKARDTLTDVREKLKSENITQFQKINKPSCVNCSFYDICMPDIH